jgi:putative tricarboxylic transport membrane protein
MTRSALLSLRRTGACMVRLSLAATLLAGASPLLAQAWKPSQNVEIITGAGAGSSQDRAARTIQNIFQTKQLIPVTAVVLNKAGGGNALALSYMQQRPADGHYLLTTSTTILSNHITGRSQTTYLDVAPIAMLYDDYNVFTVRPDSQITSGRDLIERLRKDPASVSIGYATSVGNAQHVAAAMAGKGAGVDMKKLKAVVFNASAEARTAAMGGHIDVIVTPAATVAPDVEAGKMRVIAVTSPQRIGGVYANAPTWRELGIAEPFLGGWGAVIGHRDLKPAQVAYWEATLQVVTASEEWKTYLRTHYLTDIYMRGPETKKFLERQNAEYKTVLTELGLVK